MIDNYGNWGKYVQITALAAIRTHLAATDQRLPTQQHMPPNGRKSQAAVSEERATALSVIRGAGMPLSRDQIREAYAKRTNRPIAYGTVKARLEELVEAGLLRRTPDGQRPLMYELITVSEETGAQTDDPGETGLPSVKVEHAESGIPLSEQAQKALRMIRRPRSEREPVTYDVDLLRNYNPGQSWYLTSAERVRLYELGRTTSMGQPAGTYARDIMQRLVIDLSWSSSRLEGLKYSRIDTEELLSSASAPSGVSDRDRQIILNHKAAIEFMVEEAGEIGFNRYTIMNIHGLLSENLLDSRNDEGALRRRGVIVGSSVYTPTAIPQVIEECFDQILSKADAIPDPIEQAFFMMVHIPYLQPFMDVNKRTSRLAANISLIRANLCPLSFVDVEESVYTEGTLAVYENSDTSLLRDVFVWAYERSCAQFKVLRAAMGEPNPIRLNYRNELRELVRDVVRSLSWPTDAALQIRAKELEVPDIDRNAFVLEARQELRSLCTNILARYSLRKSEYDQWAEAVTAHR